MLTRKKKIIIGVILVIVLLSLIGSCGDSDNSTRSTSRTATEETTDATETEVTEPETTDEQTTEEENEPTLKERWEAAKEEARQKAEEKAAQKEIEEQQRQEQEAIEQAQKEQQEQQALQEQQAQQAQQESVPEPEPEPEPEPVILTIENNADLYSMLTGPENYDTFVNFAAAYKGQTIQFPGSIDILENYKSYNTRYDFLLSYGDYNEESQTGPTFKMENVGNYNFTETLTQRENVMITAKVDRFDYEHGLFYLDYVSMVGR